MLFSHLPLSQQCREEINESNGMKRMKEKCMRKIKRDAVVIRLSEHRHPELLVQLERWDGVLRSGPLFLPSGV